MSSQQNSHNGDIHIPLETIVYPTSSVKMEKDRLFVFDTINKLDFLIDTGAVASIVPYMSFQNLPIQQVTSKVLAANGSPIKTYGKIKLNVNLKTYQFSHTFIVADVMNPIIGADFLNENDLVVNLRAQELTRNTTKNINSVQNSTNHNNSAIPQEVSNQDESSFNVITKKIGKYLGKLGFTCYSDLSILLCYNNSHLGEDPLTLILSHTNNNILIDAENTSTHNDATIFQVETITSEIGKYLGEIGLSIERSTDYLTSTCHSVLPVSFPNTRQVDEEPLISCVHNMHSNIKGAVKNTATYYDAVTHQIEPKQDEE